jgi:FKBP-type peptidyl-prolyl cis-trans isomerase SlyD
MIVAPDKVVSIHYQAMDETGTIVDSNEDESPLDYLHGYGNILQGLEDALTGLSDQAETKVRLAPKDAYGHYDPAMVFEVNQDQFPDGGASIEEGAVVQSSDGMELLVTKVEKDKVTLDANHPLSGKTLDFTLKITAIRDATEEEIAHGHVHSHPHESY